MRAFFADRPAAERPRILAADSLPDTLAESWQPIAPVEGEYTLLKKRASSFHGTELAGILRANGVDTILVTGVTACACVRQTICDGIADGFRTIAVKEAIGDRVPGAVAMPSEGSWRVHSSPASTAPAACWP